MSEFAQKIIAWQAEHGRHHFPWQQTSDPYPIWVAEIMLQQTQAATVVPYFKRFMASFPTVQDLAYADSDNVMAHWAGLGYYARARNLHKAAQAIAELGAMPTAPDALIQLPGIGQSTANAIYSQATDQPAAILDGNVKRVLARQFAIDGWPGKTSVQKQLWEKAEGLTPAKQGRAYTQGQMDLGADLCSRSQPKCLLCPVAASCMAYQQGNIEDYPGKKPKKSKPTKQVWMLVAHDGAEVYLVKRPPAGIWGGLHCLPEWHDEQQWQAAIEPLQQDHGNATELARIVHEFSHYTLHIHPLLLAISKEKLAQGVEDSHSLWYNPDSKHNLGLPAPVEKLLSGLASQGLIKAQA